MGLVYVEVKILNPAKPRKGLQVSCLVDSGAVYSVIPSETLRKLGIAPHSTKTFTLADGSRIARRVGDAIFVLNSQRGAAPVVFGEKGDSTLLGTLSLEAMGLLLDPLKRELRPLPLVLG